MSRESAWDDLSGNITDALSDWWMNHNIVGLPLRRQSVIGCSNGWSTKWGSLAKELSMKFNVAPKSMRANTGLRSPRRWWGSRKEKLEQDERTSWSQTAFKWRDICASSVPRQHLWVLICCQEFVLAPKLQFKSLGVISWAGTVSILSQRWGLKERPVVTRVLGVSALHHSIRSCELGGVLDSGFSLCTAPTYYHASKYFYNQLLEVWKLIWNWA